LLVAATCRRWAVPAELPGAAAAARLARVVHLALAGVQALEAKPEWVVLPALVVVMQALAALAAVRRALAAARRALAVAQQALAVAQQALVVAQQALVAGQALAVAQQVLAAVRQALVAAWPMPGPVPASTVALAPSALRKVCARCRCRPVWEARYRAAGTTRRHAAMTRWLRLVEPVPA
jgi:hypothetical protein